MLGRFIVAGVVSVATALGVAELLAGLLDGAPSPLDAVGQQLVLRLPGEVLTFAIATFGTANRTVLTASSVLVALGLGAVVGLSARSSMAAPVVAFLLAAALAYPASLAEPGATRLAVVVVLVGAVVCGLGVLWRLRGLAEAAAARTAPDSGATSADAAVQPEGDAGDGNPSRRSFVRLASGALAFGLAGGVLGRSSTGSGAPLVAPGTSALPAPQRALPAATGADLADQVPGLAQLFTPNDAFFRIDTAIAVPRVDVASWSLRIHGLVDRELVLDYDELSRRTLHEVDATISCVSNEVGGDLVGTARWLGVPLRELLEEAGPSADAEQVVGRSVDGWTGGFPLDVALDGRSALVAIGMNDEPLPFRHGYPARLVVPGLYGYVSATKWLAEIELATWDGFDGYWVPRGWSKRGPVKTSSRIDVPTDGSSVGEGAVTIAGVAWAPTRGIASVEVQLDDGDWQEADLGDPLSDETWVQWQLELPLVAGSHQLTVRATDGEGSLQPQGPRPPAPDGAEGWHRVALTVT